MTKTVDELLAEDAGETTFTSAPTKDESLELTRLCTEFAEKTARKADLEAELKELNIELNDLAHTTIPRYAEKIGQDLIGLPDAGVDVKVDNFYKANIAADWPDEQRDKAFDWLESNDLGDIIRSAVTVTFNKEELERARDLLEELRKRNYGTEFTRAVPWNTLTSTVRSLVESGEEVPLETLGATIGKVAKIKKRK